ncbi:hypothetical protein, partial [Moorena sp. SIO4G3]|uniref:hypothetical protein n=1 Tax=Moorena sp. SIO4G3 TaxID=2607821 RepID=UPI0025FB5A28
MSPARCGQIGCHITPDGAGLHRHPDGLESMSPIKGSTSPSEPCMKLSPHTAPRYSGLSTCSNVSVGGS